MFVGEIGTGGEAGICGTLEVCRRAAVWKGISQLAERMRLFVRLAERELLRWREKHVDIASRQTA